MAGGERLRALFAKYGRVAVVVHVSVALTSLAGIYTALSSNVDVVGILEGMGVGSVEQDGKKRGETMGAAATFGLALACNKLTIPIRVPITLALTKPVHTALARRGLVRAVERKTPTQHK